MPTMPKIVAAFFFAALGWFCGDLVKPLLPEGTKVGLLNITLAGIGALSGWLMCGARAGFGTRASMGYGLTSSALIVFWGSFAFAGQKMLVFAIDKRIKGPMNAMKELVAFFMDNIVLIATPTIIGAAIIGGLFGGWLTEWVSKRAS